MELLEPMDHSEAVKLMAAERYLLNELAPDLRDAFEAHFFDCPECALDLRAGAAFIAEAKLQLPQMANAALEKPSSQTLRSGAAEPGAAEAVTKEPGVTKLFWRFWWRPVFLAPVFASLLAILGYQNLVTLPGLRSAATEPRLLPWAPLHSTTRTVERTSVLADPKSGVVLTVDVPLQTTFASYRFELSNAQGKTVWSEPFTPPEEAGAWDGTVPLLIPAGGLTSGSYTLTVFGLEPGSQNVTIFHHIFDLRFNP